MAPTRNSSPSVAADVAVIRESLNNLRGQHGRFEAQLSEVERRVSCLEISERELAGQVRHHIDIEECRWKINFRLMYVLIGLVAFVALEHFPMLRPMMIKILGG